MRLRLALCLSAFVLACTPPKSGQAPEETLGPQELGAQAETVVFLVRHAERADDGDGAERMAADPEMAMMLNDPPLSEAGQARASLLATLLADVGITHIYTTDFARTRETVRPTAEAVGVEVNLYDASDPDGFTEHLRSTPGRHLVVGHSNTLPGLVEALGENPVPPIELLEYDRLYLVTIDGGVARTILLRIGVPFSDSE